MEICRELRVIQKELDSPVASGHLGFNCKLLQTMLLSARIDHHSKLREHRRLCRVPRIHPPESPFAPPPLVSLQPLLSSSRMISLPPRPLRFIFVVLPIVVRAALASSARYSFEWDFLVIPQYLVHNASKESYNIHQLISYNISIRSSAQQPGERESSY